MNCSPGIHGQAGTMHGGCGCNCGCGSKKRTGQEGGKKGELSSSGRFHPVVGVHMITETLMELVLKRYGLNFEAGDCVMLSAGPYAQARPYSIASGIHDDHLRFLIRLVPEGQVTSFLKALKPGDTVFVSAPFGWFHPGVGLDAPFAFVATGTGIAPFLSYCRSYPERAPEYCLYGVRHLHDAWGADELARKTRLMLAVSREKRADVFYGRVTDLIPQIELQTGMHFFLCGLDTMIDEVADRLEARGVPAANIHWEVFFHAQPNQNEANCS